MSAEKQSELLARLVEQLTEQEITDIANQIREGTLMVKQKEMIKQQQEKLINQLKKLK